jgi:transcriptional regulator CtsR
MNGKAYARAIRAHFQADTALYAHLVSKLGDLLSVSMSDEIVADLFDKLLKGDDVVNDICENSLITTAVEEISQNLTELAKKGLID